MRTFFIQLMLVLSFISCVKQSETAIPKSSGSTEAVCAAVSISEELTDPKTIEEAVNLINALPKPLNLECFIKVLKRPLYINATTSTLSAQPGNGVESPRIFIFKNNLIMAITPDGSLLEFSELLSYLRSVKGEVQFPLKSQLSQSMPFSRIITGSQTSCSGCHKSEREEYEVEGVKAYSSIAIRPTTSKDVNLEELNYQQYLCNFHQESTQRCRVFNALMNNGEVIPYDFPEDMPTFLESLQF